MVALWVGVLPWLTGGTEPVAILITTTALLIAIFLIWRSKQAVTAHRDILVYAGLGLVGWGGLSLLWTVNRYQTVSWFVLWSLAVTAFYVARQLQADKKLVKRWVNGYILIATLFGAYGIWLYLTADYDRLTSTFYWANPFAGYVIPAVLLAAWSYVKSGKYQYLVSAIVLLSSFWLTDSRGAALVLGVIGIYIFATVRGKSTFWIRNVLIIIIALILSTSVSLVRSHVFHHDTIQAGSRFAQAAAGDSTSVSDRIYFVGSAVDIWENYPLGGSGAGTYGVLHPIYQGRVISASQDAHSLYIQTFAELGLVGGDLLTVVVFLLLLGIWKSLRSKGPNRALALCLLALILHAGIDIDAKYPAYLILAAVIAGLWYEGKVVMRTPRPAPVIIMVCIMVLAASLYKSDALATKALSYENAGDYAQAAGYYGQAHELPAYNPDMLTDEGINYYTLATTYDQDTTVNLILARSLAKQAMKLDPDDAQDPFLLAQVLAAQHNMAAATTEYIDTLRLDPYNEPMYYGNLARLYLSEGKLNDAELVATRGIDEYPASVISNRSVDTTIPVQVSDLYVDRAAARWELGDAKSAGADLTRALQINPSNTLATQFQQEFR